MNWNWINLCLSLKINRCPLWWSWSWSSPSAFYKHTIICIHVDIQKNGSSGTRSINELHGNSIKDFMWLLPHLAAWSRRQWDHLRTESLLNAKQMKDRLFISALGRAAASTLSNCKPSGPNKQVITGDITQKTVHYSVPADDIKGLSRKLAKLSCEKFYPASVKNSSTFVLRGRAVLSLQRLSTRSAARPRYTGQKVSATGKMTYPCFKNKAVGSREKKKKKNFWPDECLESGRASVWSLFSPNCRRL